MKPDQRILYVGKDPDFLKELTHFCQRYMKKEHPLSMNYSTGCFAHAAAASIATLIFIDFTEITDAENALEEINFLKKMPIFKAILFVGLFKDENHLKQYPQLFVCGIQLSFIKGNETELLFKDSFYMSFGILGPDFLFAKAMNIYRPHYVGICSSVSKLGPQSFLIETDIDETDEFVCGLEMIPDFSPRSLKLKNKYSCKYISPMTVTYEVEYPFPDPWSSSLEESILPETIETWLANNLETLDQKKGFIQVFSEDTSLVEELFDVQKSCLFNIEFLTHVVLKDILPRIQLKRPDIIFYDTIHGKDEETGLASIIYGLAKSEQYYPIIIVSNSQTSSVAMQKAFNYKYMLAVPGKLTGLFAKLIATYMDKKRLIDRQPLANFHPSDKRRAIELQHAVNIISMSEHEIIFSISHEIPMFSVLHLREPVDCYLTLVPSPYNLSVSNDKFSYYGVIHGITEDKLMLLRRFVNMLIANPKLDFKLDLEKKENDEVPGSVKYNIKAQNEKELPAVIVPAALHRTSGFNLKCKSKL